MPGLRLVMAMSGDGFVARGPGDDMSWTAPEDKRLFSLVTRTRGALCVVSDRTRRQMPTTLPGRRLVTIRRSPDTFGSPDDMTLESAAETTDGAWLLGGQTLALEAIRRDLVWEAAVFVSRGVTLGAGQRGVLIETLDALPHRHRTTRAYGPLDVISWEMRH